MEELSKSILVNKNSFLPIQTTQLYVNDCSPSKTGVMDSKTQIEVFQIQKTYLTSITLAIIAENLDEIKNDYKDYQKLFIHGYFRPYFQSGIEKYVEEGDVIEIDHLNVLVVKTKPVEHGFVSSDTRLHFTYEGSDFLKKFKQNRNHPDKSKKPTSLELLKNVIFGDKNKKDKHEEEFKK